MSRSSTDNLLPRRNALAKALLAWFEVAQREMPWRKTRDPYAIWLSETMLQQTQVETVKPYYHKFLTCFPTLHALAAASLEEVLEMWAGLGYYRRAKHLHAAARAMLDHHAGAVPNTAAQLMELPGVGRYTAGAVASIAFGEKVPVLDGNVARVLARLTLLRQPVNDPQVVKKLWVIAETLLEAAPAATRPGDFNQALMELGALICTPRSPQCLTCPLAAFCQARKVGQQDLVPIKIPKIAAKTRKCVSLVLHRPESPSRTPRYLLLQRPAGGLWNSMWEFPTFEMPAPQVVNWVAQMTDVVKDRLGLAADLEPWRGEIRHQLTHRTLQVTVARGSVRGRKAPRLPACDRGDYQAARWVTPTEMLSMAVAEITRRIARAAELTATQT